MSIGRFGCRDITARLVAIATLPAFLLFVAIVSTLYVRMLEDVREDVSERGRFTAVALAESSRYGVISGNTAVLERALKAVIDSEPSIAAIVVEDAGHRRLTTVGDDKLPFVIGPFEAPMHTDVPNVDLFDEGSAPHLAQSAEAAPRFSADAVAGYVLVYTQIEPLLKERRRRLWLAVALVGLATVLSGLAGLILAQRLRAPLNAVMTALLQIREGRFDVALPETSRGDIADLNRAVNEMAKAMNRTHQELEGLVQQRTAELQRAVAEKRRLIARGNEIVEEERRRLAAEIHDNLNASLVFVKLESTRIRDLAARLPSSTGFAEAQREINDIAARINSMTGQVYDAARNIIKSLRPEIIDTLGLEQAIKELVHHYDSVHPECVFAVRDHSPLPSIGGAIAITAYRVLQEALTNIVKHAKARHASVALSHDADSNSLSIVVIDDGIGFEATTATPSAGIGLLGMRERVGAVGGSISIASSSAGTQISISLPLAPPTLPVDT